MIFFFFRSNLVLVFKIDSALIVILHICPAFIIRMRLDIRELQPFFSEKIQCIFQSVENQPLINDDQGD